MPTIYDNIDSHLIQGLKETLQVSQRADFCMGYFNLRGWKLLDSYIESWQGTDDSCCRLLVGMQKLPHDELREALATPEGDEEMDNQTAIRLKKRLAEEFRQQLLTGTPTNEDEAGLQRLARQIRARQVRVKLYLRNTLHAKLYLCFRPNDPNTRIIGFLGSSNLTFSGLKYQGELNVDVLEQDACQKLAQWFECRWEDRFCIDISEELAKIIESSWAREDLIPPYHVYIKMAYHLSQEARSGLSEFKIPKDFKNELFEFQMAAVKIAAHHLHKRNGVLIGDVVGLGKTLMATAVARIFEDDFDLETLIICPKNLVPMWKDYREAYRLRGKVLSISQVIKKLPDLRRYRLIVIDESHNLRNREGKRYRAIQEYIRENDSRIILLSATPYNKSYLDLSSQLRLFVDEEKDIGIRPEQLLRDISETEFIRRHQCSTRSLAAFEKSYYSSDWQDLMRLYLVRRTRSFIKENYALTDSANGKKYISYGDNSRAYFPDRVPRTVKFTIDEKSPDDQYARLYAESVVDTINSLNLPRYGLGNYIASSPHKPPTQAEAKQLADLGRAGKRLMGFCRTNLFKRLESSGSSFLQSIERHILRNYIYIHAIKNDLSLPIGTQDVAMLDTRITDQDSDQQVGNLFDDNDDETYLANNLCLRSEKEFQTKAKDVYEEYERQYGSRFKWLRPGLFIKSLVKDLEKDSKALMDILRDAGNWDPQKDEKLNSLYRLLTHDHPDEKILVFTQFADTVYYLKDQLKEMGVRSSEGVTGDSAEPTSLAWRFSPESNKKRNHINPEQELRVLVATDILSEGQNLQDCAIVVNYDLPWAIIRLIQRAGRVDRIGQKADMILCYSFLPVEGVEKIIRLRQRVRQRLTENAEVVGADEAFFEDHMDKQTALDLYNEKSDILDDDDQDVDLASRAYEIWKKAIEDNPRLKKEIEELPDVVYSTRPHRPSEKEPEGVLCYMKTAEGNDALAYMNKHGESITESQYEILKLAECKPDTPAIPRHQKHHSLVSEAVRHVAREEKKVGGQLGRPSGARYRTYVRLKSHTEALQGTLFEYQANDLQKALDMIYRYPLRQAAIDMLNRQLRSGIDDEHLAELVLLLKEEGKLCIVEEEMEYRDPRIICSMGMFEKEK